MQRINLDEKWCFRREMLDSVDMLQRDPGELVIENAQLGSFRTRVPVHGTGLSGLSSLYGGAKCRI